MLFAQTQILCPQYSLSKLQIKINVKDQTTVFQIKIYFLLKYFKLLNLESLI